MLRIADLAADFEKIWAGAELEGKRHILRLVIRCIEVHKARGKFLIRWIKRVGMRYLELVISGMGTRRHVHSRCAPRSAR